MPGQDTSKSDNRHIGDLIKNILIESTNQTTAFYNCFQVTVTERSHDEKKIRCTKP